MSLFLSQQNPIRTLHIPLALHRYPSLGLAALTLRGGTTQLALSLVPSLQPQACLPCPGSEEAQLSVWVGELAGVGVVESEGP